MSVVAFCDLLVLTPLLLFKKIGSPFLNFVWEVWLTLGSGTPYSIASGNWMFFQGRFLVR
jgi:hypothetical protein